jgi:heme exporter protein A
MLQARGLQLARGARRGRERLDFELRPGTALQIDGANGAGKTTLLRTVCGLQTPAAGELAWCGDALPGAREALARELAWLGHRDGLTDEWSAADNLAHALRLGAEVVSPAALVAALAAVGLEAQARRPVRTLSQGQRRRVALARFAVTRKRLWVLDEPTASLDESGREAVDALLERHVRQGGLLLFSSHASPCRRTDSIRRLSLPADAETRA